MSACPPLHLVRITFLLATTLTFAPPSKAQIQPAVAELPIGENYHIELMAGTWSPTPAMKVSSNAFGITGTHINLTSDLGITPDRFNDLRLRLRVAPKLSPGQLRNRNHLQTPTDFPRHRLRSRATHQFKADLDDLKIWLRI